MNEDRKAYELYTEVESSLSEDMQEVKRSALSGDAASQFKIGLHYFDTGMNTGDSRVMMPVGIGFMARAAKQGQADALGFFRREGQDWRDFI